MLTLELPMVGDELFNNELQQFMLPGDLGTFQFEHSLKTVAEWESVWLKPFLTSEPKSFEELRDYYRCMCLQDLPDIALTPVLMETLNNYLGATLSATKVNNDNSSGHKIITSEVIYGLMVEGGIPFETENWHLSRLLKLIEVVGAQRTPPKKMSNQEILEQNKKINEERRRKFNTKG